MPGRSSLPLTPELIPRIGVVAEPRWSPDGRRLGWVRIEAGRADVVVLDDLEPERAPGAADRAPSVVTAVTGAAGTRATGGGVWCWVDDERIAVVDPDGRLLLVSVDRVDDGDEARVLAAEGRATAPAATRGGERVAFVLQRADACDIAVIDLSVPEATPRVVSASDFAWDPAWSPDGARLAWHEWDLAAMSWQSSRIVVADGEGAPTVVAGGDGVAVGQPRFSPAGDRLAWISDAGGWAHVVVGGVDGADPVPVLDEPFEHAEPAWGVGQRSYAWSSDGHEIALCRNEDGFGRLVVVRADGSGEARDVERGWHHGIDWGPSGIAAVRSGARTPPTICVTSADAGSSRIDVARSAPAGLDRDALVEPEPVTWTGDDGATVYGLLFQPPGDASARPPLVVDVHGGPTGQATAQWKPYHQHLVARGCAVLAPDPRGSTGHGRAYADALAGAWGVVDVADCAAGLRAAIERGWCDPERVVVSGGSSGGLLALLLAMHHPELVQAVVTMYPVVDLVELARTTHRFESRYSDWLVGELPGDVERYRERSPITHAARLRATTLVLNGAADEVVSSAQVRAFVEAVRESGGTIEHHEYPDEGHGWSRPETTRDVYERVDAFLRERGVIR